MEGRSFWGVFCREEVEAVVEAGDIGRGFEDYLFV